MAAPYIPTSDAAADAWSQNFNDLITATPAAYGLDASDALAIDAAVDLYHDAYLLAGVSGTPPKTPLSPATRTPVTIADKDAKKAAMIPLLRVYANLINNNQGVTNEQREDLQLTIRKTTKTPIPTPVSAPIISILAATVGQVQFNMRDTLTPTVRRKPFGAIHAQIFIHFSDLQPAAPLDSDYYAIANKTPFALDFTGARAGQTAWMWARWQTLRGLVGTYSDVLQFVVPAGGGT